MKKFLLPPLMLSLLLIVPAPPPARAEFKSAWGSSLRLRHEYWKNVYDINNGVQDNRNFFRIKTSVWGQLDVNEKTRLSAKLTDEFKPYVYYAPSSSKPTGKTDKAYHFDISEICVDNLYIDLKNLASWPLDWRIGRQDLTGYGEDFLIREGTPGDGSRTFYFNAVKASGTISEEAHIELIYFNNPRDDTWLPVINEDKAPQNLATTDENGVILYLRSAPAENLALENYYIFKQEGADGGTGLQAHQGEINTIGSFARYTLDPCVLRAQLAVQTGEYGTQDRSGLGGYLFLDHDFKDTAWSPRASAGYVYLSGDDKSTGKNESWNPLFSRHAWLSELYCLTYKTETGIGNYWSNLQMWRAGLTFKPLKKTQLSLWYNFLRANERIPATADTFSGAGRTRGHLPQARVDYEFSKNAAAYFLAEYLIPGDVYIKDRGEAVFLRTEVQLKF